MRGLFLCAHSALLASAEVAEDPGLISWQLAIASENEDNSNSAEEHYRNALQSSPSKPEIYFNLGELLLKTKRYDEALHGYQGKS
jgi:Tfp pilus assembly protein PilF